MAKKKVNVESVEIAVGDLANNVGLQKLMQETELPPRLKFRLPTILAIMEELQTARNDAIKTWADKYGIVPDADGQYTSENDEQAAEINQLMKDLAAETVTLPFLIHGEDLMNGSFNAHLKLNAMDITMLQPLIKDYDEFIESIIKVQEETVPEGI